MNNKRNGLRPVTFEVDGKVCYGYFHRFAQNQALTYALVESESGEIFEVLSHNIAFQDSCSLSSQEDKPLNNLELAELVASRTRISTEDMLTIIEGIESGYSLKDNPIYAIASRDRRIKELQSILDEEVAVYRESRNLAEDSTICRDGSDKECGSSADENLALYANIIESATKESVDIVAKALNSILSGAEKYQEDIGDTSDTAKKITSQSDYLLDALASEWNSFSPQKKLSIATSVSGRYQTARFIVLIDELSKIHDSET